MSDAVTPSGLDRLLNEEQVRRNFAEGFKPADPFRSLLLGESNATPLATPLSRDIEFL
jgi:hypothetical protein